jgi:methylated-DNA-[protein]-cysteine S-methyltransferase
MAAQARAAFNYSRISSPVGPAHLLASERGLAAIYFGEQVPAMDRRFPLERRGGFGRNLWLLRTEAFLHCYFSGDLDFAPEIALDLQGTPFQLAVWEELQAIPAGETACYGEIAKRIGRPQASRAVGAAIGRNPVSVLVPCHRVVGSTGKLTGYAGGLKIKRFLLDHEQACRGGRRDDLPLLFE